MTSAVGTLYLRVAHPIEHWDGTIPADNLAEQLAAETSWSLFMLAHVEPLTVLGAFYGWRTGPGPRTDCGYHVFTDTELAVASPSLRHTPQNWTHGWPPDVRDSHYDLEGFTAGTAKAFLAKIGTLGTRLKQATRKDIFCAQRALLQRNAVPADFQARVNDRLKKLKQREPNLYATVVESVD